MTLPEKFTDYLYRLWKNHPGNQGVDLMCDFHWVDQLTHHCWTSAGRNFWRQEDPVIMLDWGGPKPVRASKRILYASLFPEHHPKVDLASPSTIIPLYTTPRKKVQFEALNGLIVYDSRFEEPDDTAHPRLLRSDVYADPIRSILKKASTCSFAISYLPVQFPLNAWLIRRGLLLYHTKPWHRLSYDPLHIPNLNGFSNQLANLRQDYPKWKRYHLAQVGYYNRLLALPLHH